jgi:hypothetical protein
VHTPAGQLMAGDGHWPPATAALPRSRAPARPPSVFPSVFRWAAAPVGRAYERAGSPFPVCANQAENGHRPVNSHGPAQYQYWKINFCFLLLFHDEKYFGKCFVVLSAPKIVK